MRPLILLLAFLAGPALAASAEVRPAPRPAPSALPVLVLDPGHGGRDPGARTGTGAARVTEADLMLDFAREVADAVAATRVFEVRLTRDADVYVPLEGRLAAAQGAGAAAFVSLHADALPDGAGLARGATVYTLADGAGDAASRRLVERHERAGLPDAAALTASDGDEIALVLLDLARTETGPRADALGDAILDAFRADGLAVAGRPRRAANFSVLKSAAIPSVLVELGFLSSDTDRTRLATPEGRAPAAAALARALAGWWAEDAERRALRGR